MDKKKIFTAIIGLCCSIVAVTICFVDKNIPAFLGWLCSSFGFVSYLLNQIEKELDEQYRSLMFDKKMLAKLNFKERKGKTKK